MGSTQKLDWQSTVISLQFCFCCNTVTFSIIQVDEDYRSSVNVLFVVHIVRIYVYCTCSNDTTILQVPPWSYFMA